MPAPGIEDRLPQELPLVGRKAELQRLFTLFGEGPAATRFRLLAGEGGVGKSRLALTLAAEAERREWSVLRGRAYPVEQGVPYAVVADAFVPLLQEVDPARLTVLTRGREADLHRLFPALGLDAPRDEGLDPEEVRTRLFWTFGSLLKGLAKDRPVLVVLEDLHWADPSSASLLHFLARQLDDHPVRLLGTYTLEDRERNPPLVQMERSLESLGRLDRLDLAPLDLAAIQELLDRVFHMSGAPVADFAQRIFGWTRGNPYFVEQTLQALVQQEELYLQDGTWLGWESRELTLPSTIRDAILVRFQGLDPLAREAAEIVAVSGRPTPARLVERVLARDRKEIAGAVAQLVSRGIVEERARDGDLLLQLRHPLSRETLYRGLSMMRRRLLHEQVAAALEALYGDEAEEHADEIAYHLTREGVGEADPRAARYLALAGDRALERHADQEAADYLAAALQALGDDLEPDLRSEALRIRRALARARTRKGRYEEAEGDWAVLLADAQARGDEGARAAAHRHLGLLAYWRGRHSLALEHLDEARNSAPPEAWALKAQVELASGMAYQQLGRAQESRQRILEALDFASNLEDQGLLARVHRALALVNTWIGETEEARSHGLRAVELGREAHDPAVVFWGQWALASLEGLVGGPGPMRPWLDAVRETADGLGSPLMDLWVDELELEYTYFSGAWDDALALGTRAVQRARVLHQKGLLVRLLVWTSSVFLHRGDLEAAGELVDEACRVAGVEGRATPETRDVHVAVPALIGRTALLMAQGEVERALEVGRNGLAVAEASGYVIWVLHRLLPLVGEACIRLQDLDGARDAVGRLREEGRRMDHRMSQVWATAGEALVTWHGGEIERSAGLLREAADAMEEIGIVFDAARIRRQLAGRLLDLGRKEEGLAELQRVGEVFRGMGADPELRQTREMYREVGEDPPSAVPTRGGPSPLSPRQYEVAGYVARRWSNQRIAGELDLGIRTVEKHLTNIYSRLQIEGSMVAKRALLGDMIREGKIPPPGGR